MSLPSLLHYQSQSRPSQPHHSPYSQSLPTPLHIHTQMHDHQRSSHSSSGSQMYSPRHSGFTSHPPPVPPPSPPVEESTKCQLPSISTLLNYAEIGNSNERHQKESSPHPASHPQPRAMALPPTPPMRPDSVFELVSPLSSTSSPQFYPAQTQPGNRQSYPPALKQTQYTSHPDFHSPQYYSQPHSAFKPTPPTSAPSTSNPWQHHHHSAPASQAAFPQSQDRYICSTCNKAFSRPSSLRIHSHSHTGEKPFKCPHHGCGKAFSVRSNMKRHERGCHQ